MDSNYSSNQPKKGSDQGQPDQIATLVLHNDDVNSFDHVMECLESICDHSLTQAEQCATIAHYKGQCEILRGNAPKLKHCRHELISRGLKVTIE